MPSALGVIRVLAGGAPVNPQPGRFFGDGGPATAARLGEVGGIAVDGQGNAYLTDITLGANGAGSDSVSEIRTLLRSDGTIQRSAGPWQGKSVTGIVSDEQGDLFVAFPSDRSVVEFVRATHQTRVLAAGSGTLQPGAVPANQAGLNGPTALALDSSGNLFVADTLNNVVREISRADETIRTVAGDGFGGFAGDGGPAAQASLNQPTAIAISPNGDLIIADTGNNRIRMVDTRTGVIRTIAGIGSAGFSGNGVSALHASLNHPRGVAVDQEGNIFVADTDNNVIRELVASSKTLWTVVGTGAIPEGEAAYRQQISGVSAKDSMLRAPGALAVDATGRLIISDQGDALIRVVAVSS